MTEKRYDVNEAADTAIQLHALETNTGESAALCALVLAGAKRLHALQKHAQKRKAAKASEPAT